MTSHNALIFNHT